MASMSLPDDDTLVSYPGGAVSGRGTVLHLADHASGIVLLTDRTPFHPVDPRWPDQGPDHGLITYGGVSVPLLDCVIGATDGTQLSVGADMTARRGEPGWAFVVAHVIPAGERRPAVGDEIAFEVDADHRLRLSAGHTGCHVAALGLNAALAERWRKPVRTDGLGHPDFDQLAIVSSRITPDGAVDTYRVGRSLRKKGFDVDGLDAALPDIEEAINRQLANWVAAGADIQLEIHGPRLTDLREWICTLPEGVQRIPCGGTHLRSLTEVSSLAVELRADVPAGDLTMTTTVGRADAG